jgi:hypothetical protein
MLPSAKAKRLPHATVRHRIVHELSLRQRTLLKSERPKPPSPIPGEMRQKQTSARQTQNFVNPAGGALPAGLYTATTTAGAVLGFFESA